MNRQPCRNDECNAMQSTLDCRDGIGHDCAGAWHCPFRFAVGWTARAVSLQSLEFPLLSFNGWGKAMLTVQYLLSQVGDGRWQDVMLSAGNIFFCFTLIPMLRQPERPPLLTCIPSGLALLAGGFVFATLHLWLTALTQTITGLQWLALVLKRSPKAASSFTNSWKSIATTTPVVETGGRPSETANAWRRDGKPAQS